MNLENKVIAITGGGGDLARAVAVRLGKAGAKLALIDLDPDKLIQIKKELNSESIHAETYTVDIANETAVVQLFEDIVSDLGQLDGLVNNAGIIRDGLLIKVKDGQVLKKMSLDQWQSVIDVNLTGAFLCGREAAAVMAVSGKGGCIVNISSIAAVGNFGQSNYSSAKAGVIAMSVTWAKELAQYGIRSAAIAPGFIETKLLLDMKPQALENIVKTIPAKRLASTDEIASAVDFVFNNDYFTGRVIEVDGGLRL